MFGKIWMTANNAMMKKGKTLRLLDLGLGACLVLGGVYYLAFYYTLRKYFGFYPMEGVKWAGIGFLAPILAAVLTPMALVGLGDVIREAMGPAPGDRAGRWTLDAGLGLAAVCFIGWGLGFAGLGSMPNVVAIDILILAVAGIRWRKIISENAGPSAVVDFFKRRSGFEIFLLSLAALMALMVLIRALAPPIEVDELSDHLAIARRVLEGGALPRIPYRTYGYFPVFMQMGSVMSMPLGPSAARILHAWTAMFLALELFRIGREIGGGRAGVLAGVMFFTVPIAVWTASVAFTDLAWCFFALLGVRYAVHDEFRPGVSGLFFGCAIMSKYLAGGVWLGTGLALAFQLLRQRKTAAGKRLLWFLIWLAAPAVLLSFWGLRNYLFAGNPFYPFLSGFFKPGPASPEFLREYNTFMSEYGAGRGLSQLIRFPFFITFWGDILFERNTFDPRFLIGPLSLILSPLFLIGALGTQKGRKLGFITIVFFACWWMSFHVARFLILPVLVYLVISMAGMEMVRKKFNWSMGVMRAIVSVVVLISALVMALNLGGEIHVALGLKSRDEYLSRNNSFYNMTVRINERRDVTKLAMVLQTDELYLKPPCVWINVANGFGLDMGRISSAGQGIERLRKMGVSHVLVNRYRMGKLVYLKAPYQKKFRDIMKEMLKSGELVLVDSWREYELYRITSLSGR